MTAADSAPFAAGMTALAAVTGKQLDALTNQAYWVVLEKVPGEIVIQALRKAMDHFDFFPSAADLLRLCDEVDTRPALDRPHALALLDAGVVTVHGQTHFEPPENLYWCRVCNDSGFEPHIAHPGHKPYERWVTRCSCAQPTEGGFIQNPIIRERIDRAQQAANVGKYAPKALTRGRRRYREN